MNIKLVLPVLLSLIFLSCKEEKQIEIIPDYDRIYLPPNQLTEIPKLIEGNDQQLMDSVTHTYLRSYSFEDTLKNRPTMEYKFMISETGFIEKIFFGKDNDKSIDQIVLNTVKDWKYKPGVKDGKNVKSQSPMILWFESNPPINENNYTNHEINPLAQIEGTKITYSLFIKQKAQRTLSDFNSSP